MTVATQRPSGLTARPLGATVRVRSGHHLLGPHPLLLQAVHSLIVTVTCVDIQTRVIGGADAWMDRIGEPLPG